MCFLLYALYIVIPQISKIYKSRLVLVEEARQDSVLNSRALYNTLSLSPLMAITNNVVVSQIPSIGRLSRINKLVSGSKSKAKSFNIK